MALTLTFLGSGTSAGVPMIGCNCDVCRSDDPRDQRSRASVTLSWPDGKVPDGQRRLLIDTAPEMRQQIIAAGINRIDGVLYTHTHSDHVVGLDDLRRFNAVMDQPLDLYAESHAWHDLRRMFAYVFESGQNPNRSFIPTLIPHKIEAEQAFEFHGATVTPLRLLHGKLKILGFRVDLGDRSLAYCTDVSSIPPETWPYLQDLDLLVMDALRYRHHPTHMTVDQALAAIDQAHPTQAVLTHIAHDIRHADLAGELPDGVDIAYDGLSITLDANGPRTVTADQSDVSAAGPSISS